MKSLISASLMPDSILSRISMRRTPAGSAAAGAASMANAGVSIAASKSWKTNLRSIEFFHLRKNRVAPDFRRNRTGLLVADDAGLVDDKGFGHAVDTEFDACPALQVGYASAIGVAQTVQQAARIVRLILVIQAVDRYDVGFGKLDQNRMLLAATTAPGCPHIEQPDLAAHLHGSQHTRGRIERLQAECGCRLVDERRRHLARSELEAHAQIHQHGIENRQRNQVARLHAASARRPTNAACSRRRMRYRRSDNAIAPPNALTR